jgi:competence protein ComEA
VISITRGQAAVVVLGLVAALALVGTRLASVGATKGPAVAEAPTPVRTSHGAAAPSIVVHVVGAVRRAGLYRLSEGARVADAIRRAGGSTGRADTALVNLAAPVADGMQVIVPARMPAAGAADGTAGGGGAALQAKVSLAVATVAELDDLPGVGPVTAQRIVEWRQSHGPFASVDDLDAIPGIGPARVEQLRDLVTP